MEIATDRKALVTGGASGIGLEIARRLGEAGAALALLDLPGERLDAAAAELAASAVPADVSSPSEVGAAVSAAVDALDGLDTLVLCAGIAHAKPLAEVSERDWDRTLDVNLKGTFLCCQAAAAALAGSGRGRIVTIGSDAGKRGVPQMLAYTASKFGVVGLTEALAAELAPAVTVNCVCPVGVPTTGMGEQLLAWKSEHTAQSPEDVLSSVATSIPLGRNATAADVAAAALFFISDSAGFLTGISLDVDGGSRLNAIPGAED